MSSLVVLIKIEKRARWWYQFRLHELGYIMHCVSLSLSFSLFLSTEQDRQVASLSPTQTKKERTQPDPTDRQKNKRRRKEKEHMPMLSFCSLDVKKKTPSGVTFSRRDARREMEIRSKDNAVEDIQASWTNARGKMPVKTQNRQEEKRTRQTKLGKLRKAHLHECFHMQQ